jgi:hypothetical protein
VGVVTVDDDYKEEDDESANPPMGITLQKVLPRVQLDC